MLNFAIKLRKKFHFSCLRTFTRRGQIVWDPHDSTTEETKQLNTVLLRTTTAQTSEFEHPFKPEHFRPQEPIT